MKNPIFSGRGFTKNQYVRGKVPKNGGLGQFADLSGGLAKESGWCFCGGGGLIPHCTLWQWSDTAFPFSVFQNIHILG